MKKQWRLPNGELTSNANKMVKAWEDVYKPICRVTGANVIGFDPGVLFSSPYGKPFDLPTSIAVKLAEVIVALEDVVEKHSKPQKPNVAFRSIEAAKAILTPPPDKMDVHKDVWKYKPVKHSKAKSIWEKK